MYSIGHAVKLPHSFPGVHVTFEFLQNQFPNKSCGFVAMHKQISSAFELYGSFVKVTE